MATTWLRSLTGVLTVLAGGVLSIALGGHTLQAAEQQEILLYSGRSSALVQPLVAEFETKTGIKVRVKDGKTSALASVLIEEGDKSPADVFWAQDAGALGSVAKAGLFQKLPQGVLGAVSEAYRHPSGEWVATSGRARVLAYSSERVQASELPKSIFELTQPKWKGKVGWAPTNASFHSFVTALRKLEGEEKAKAWLVAMKANDTKAYPDNNPIIKAIAAGEIDLGLPNHYYLLQAKKTDPKLPVAQTRFQAGDVGNLVNVAGVGILKTSKRSEAAQKFVEFLVSKEGQAYFVSKVSEYPVTSAVEPAATLPKLEQLMSESPKLNLSDLDDLEGTIKLLKEAGVL